LALATGALAQYAVIYPGAIGENRDWMEVVVTLSGKYEDSSVYPYVDSPLELRDELASVRPRYICLVLPPRLADSRIVALMHRLSRSLDDDPYGDCLWGIITGCTASDALRIARASTPLAVRRGFGTTGFRTGEFTDALIISDSKRGDVFLKVDGGEGEKTEHDPNAARGLTYLLEDFWHDKKPQLFVTSGHATQYNLEMSWGQGLITCHDNKFYALRRDQVPGFARFLRGVMFEGSEEDVANYVRECAAPVLPRSEDTPKVWLGAGNCLLGDCRGSTNSMAVTALSSGGFNQLVGYTVTTWFGRMGWGTLGRFQGSQRPTLAEAFFLNNQALLDESERRYPGLLDVQIASDAPFFPTVQSRAMMTRFKQAGIEKLDRDALGLLHDRDTVAFFGDPRWEARMPQDGDAPIRVSVEQGRRGAELTIRTSAAFKAGGGFDVIFQRPIPQASIEGVEGWELRLTDDFLLVRSSDLVPSETRTIRVRR